MSMASYINADSVDDSQSERVEKSGLDRDWTQQRMMQRTPCLRLGD